MRRAFRQTVMVRCSDCKRKLRQGAENSATRGLWLNHAQRCGRKWLGPDAP